MLHYLSGLGSLPVGNAWPGSSARISYISDSRGTSAYTFNYTAGLTPMHLTGITSYLAPAEQYTFSYGSQSLTAPFGGSFGTVSTLSTLTTPGINTSHQFAYNGSGEMTQLTTPLGGTLGWSYRNYTYSGAGATYREVQSRTASSGAFSGAMSNTWNMTTDSGALQHATWTVSDTGANSSKVWTFGASAPSQAVATSYEERGPGGTALIHTDYTWTTDSAGNIYVGAVVNTKSPGSGQIQSKSTQTLDTYGNISHSEVYDYGNLSTPAKTYNFTYMTDPNVDVNYVTRYIRNRLKQATVTPAGGSPMTLVTNTYDAYSGAPCYGTSNLTARTGALDHDDTNYGVSFTYRGNLTYHTSVGGSGCTAYETTGVVSQATNGAGVTVTSTLSQNTNYSLPDVLTPGGNSNLATTVTYASSWAVASVTGPNGAQGSTNYDSYGRPQSTSIPDGASTNYTYSYVGVGGATANQQTATLGSGAGARWKRTTLDGFGRVTRVETGHDSTTVSQVDTQYAPCACSPLGKMYRVSQPYALGGSPVWTTYTYDGSGRTTSVTLPDGSVSTTQYLTSVTDPASNVFTGDLAKATDAAGKWKIQRSDAMGNLAQVIEPNPDTSSNGQYLTSNYTYNAINQLTQVVMRRYAPGSNTSYTDQTRTFAYTGTDLTSATNPENGTVQYQYDGAHHVTQRTDAKGQQTRYSYDPYGRLTEVQHWTWYWNGGNTPAYILAEDPNQRVDYYYDFNPCDGSFSQNAWGRLTAVNFLLNGYNTGCVYQYSYNKAGRVTSQKMAWQMQDGSAPYTHDYSLTAVYEWDDNGRMTSIAHPSVTGGQFNKLTYQFDAMGRVSTVTDTGLNSPVANATYGVAGEILSMGYFGLGETRQYNNMFQMTRQTVTNFASNVMDMQYVYTSGANNGRIAKSIDGITGETVDYTYDVWNRLIQAQTEGTIGVQWGQSYTYDGFGNMTAKGVTKGSAPTFSTNINPATNGGPTSFPQTPDGSVDVENRSTHGLAADYSQAWYTYDHAGKRVLVKSGSSAYWFSGTWEFAMYGVGGRLMTVSCSYVNNSTPICANQGRDITFLGKRVMVKGVAVVTDRLGTVRANSNGESFAYYPYGEERTSTADGREKFGTYVRDNPNQDYADQRYYNVGTGRFNVPDPSGDSWELEDPNSWNLYSYVNGDPINFNDPTGLGPVTLPPVVPGINCSTAFINFAAQFGETIQDLFNTDQGVLGVMSFFEQQGSGTASDEKVWAAVDWTFINRWNLSAKDKAWFYGPGNAPTSFQATITTGPTRSQVFTSDGQLTAGFTTQLLNILTGSPGSKQCAGLVDAFDTAMGVIEAANGLKAGDRGALVTPIPDPYPGALAFGSNGAVPSHSRYVRQVAVGTIVDGLNTWTFYSDRYMPPPPVRQPPRRRGR